VEYRVEQLARTCDVSVDTVRYYRTIGLIEPPRRSGRVALYDDSHADRINTIRALQRKGLPLALIRRALDGTLRRSDAELAEAVAAAQADDDEALTLEQVAERTGVPTALLRAIEKAGLELGHTVDGRERYSAGDVEVVRQGLRLIERGFPMNELLELGKRYDAAAREAVDHAIELFDAYVRTPINEAGLEDDEAAEQLAGAFAELLPAVTALVTHHFRRVLLAAAERHLEQAGPPAVNA